MATAIILYILRPVQALLQAYFSNTQISHYFFGRRLIAVYFYFSIIDNEIDWLVGCFDRTVYNIENLVLVGCTFYKLR